MNATDRFMLAGLLGCPEKAVEVELAKAKKKQPSNKPKNSAVIGQVGMLYGAR